MRQWETVHCCFRVRSSIRLYCVYLLTEERVSGWYCVVIQLCKQLYSCFAIMGHLQLWVISNSIVTNICGWMTYNCDTNASQIMLSYLYISKYIYEKHGHVIWKSEIPLWTFDLHGVFFWVYVICASGNIPVFFKLFTIWNFSFIHINLYCMCLGMCSWENIWQWRFAHLFAIWEFDRLLVLSIISILIW